MAFGFVIWEMNERTKRVSKAVLRNMLGFIVVAIIIISKKPPPYCILYCIVMLYYQHLTPVKPNESKSSVIL